MAETKEGAVNWGTGAAVDKLNKNILQTSLKEAAHAGITGAVAMNLYNAVQHYDVDAGQWLVPTPDIGDHVIRLRPAVPR